MSKKRADHETFLSLPCPYCGAEVGEPCESREYLCGFVEPHAARIKARLS